VVLDTWRQLHPSLPLQRQWPDARPWHARRSIERRLRHHNSGQVVGFAYTAGNAATHAFLYNRSGSMQDLGTLGGLSSSANGINNSAQVVGYSLTASGYQHAFLCNGSGPMQDLGELVEGQYSISDATSINNSGLIVGWALTASGDDHAFLYSGGSLTDLNSLIDPVSGWTLQQANAINNNGQIVGYGRNAAWQSHAFLLTPTPEPSALVLLGMGAFALLAYAWQRRRGCY